MTEIEKTLRVLDENRYFSLATADQTGKPWISTIFYAYDKNFNFFWSSKKDSRHSSNIAIRPDVALNFYWIGPGEDNVDGLYIEAEAKEVTSLPDLVHALTTYSTRLLKNKFLTQQGFKMFLAHPEDFLMKSPFRLYTAVPKIVHKFVPLENWKDKWVDGRIEIPLNELKAAV